MDKILTGICIGFLILSCNKKTENSSFYIISKTDRELQEELKRTNRTILINFSFYGPNEILIDSFGNLYHRDLVTQKKSESPLTTCSYGQENDTLPQFINLQPKDLIQLSDNNIESYAKQNILNKAKNRQILIIASQTDTIKNIAFLKFLKKIKVPTYLIRRTTQEEDTILRYKKNNKPYYPEEIKWDKSKIKFHKKYDEISPSSK